MPLTTVDGKMMPALKVFRFCIKFLKDCMIEQCKKQGYEVLRPDIRWVITVPAIWNDEAKQFMRKAAEMVKTIQVTNNTQCYSLGYRQ